MPKVIPHNRLYTLIFSCLATLLLPLVCLIGFIAIRHSQASVPPEIDETYKIDFATLLGPDWQVGPDRINREDYWGWDPSIVGSISQYAENPAGSYVFIDYRVTRYTDT